MNSELHIHPGDDIGIILADLNAAKSKDEVLKVTLYNLDMNSELAQSLNRLVSSRLLSLAQPSTAGIQAANQRKLTLEILGCTGCVNIVVEEFASGIFRDTEGSTRTPVQRELILQHNNPNHFDASVFVALGMALDCRTTNDDTPKPPRDPLQLRLYQPVLSEGKLWTLTQGIQHSHHLTELDLSSCRFTPLHINRATQYMADGLMRNRHLKHLQLDNCNLTDDQIVCILQAIEQQGHSNSQLKTLNLAKNKCRRRGMIAMAPALSSSATAGENDNQQDQMLPPLHLNLSDQQISLADDTPNNHLPLFFHPEVVQAWQEYPLFLKRLSTLNLALNRLTDQDLQSLLELLFQQQVDGHVTSSIQDLELSMDHLTEHGVQQVAEIIQRYQLDNSNQGHAPMWKRLCLRGSLSKDAEEAVLPILAEAIQTNVFLEGLIVGNIGASDWPRRSSIASPRHCTSYYTMLNMGGRRVLQQQAHVPLALWPLILDRVNHHADLSRYQEDEVNAKINVIHYLVRHGSFLLQQHT